MVIFNKCHASFLGFLVFAIVGAAGYSINQGDYFQHQYTFIVVKSLLLFLSFGYAHFFAISSGSGIQHLAEVSRGISLSLILTSSVFGPIQEELIFRGLLQGAVFDNSWLGLVLTSSLFSFMHGPSNVPSFIFYLLGGLLLGFAYKKSQNLWVSTLVHMFYNSLPLLTYIQ